MSNWLKDKISASEIINLINLTHPNGNSEAAKQGKIEHKRIIDEVVMGKIPKQLARVNIVPPVESPTKSSYLEIEQGLWLSVIPDLRSKDKVFELKPNPREIRYYLTQLAIGCMVEDRNKGVLFFHQNENVYGLTDGGYNCWEVLKKMAIQARKIYDNQEIIDKSKPTIAEKYTLGKESMHLRNCFDINTEIVFRSLRAEVKSLN